MSKPRPLRNPASRLACDERGAIMLLATFMAVFLAAALFYLVGIGEALTQRAAAQDAADAVAFSAAVLHAKGMNVMVLINFIMAAALAVLIAIRMIESLAIVAAIALTGAAPWVPAAATAVPPMTLLAKQAHTQFEQHQPTVYSVIRTLNRAGHGLASAFPMAAQARAVETAWAAHKPRVTAGLAVPETLALPIEDGDPNELCERAGRLAGELAATALLAPLPGGFVRDLIKGVIGGAVEALAKGAPGWFCGQEGSGPAKVTSTIEVAYPELPAARDCREALESSAQDAAAHCDRVPAEARDAEPHRSTGDCQQNCGPNGPYQQRVAAARKQCHPDTQAGLRDYIWQRRIVEKEYRFARGTATPTGAEGVVRVTSETTSAPPCQTGGRGLAVDWNRSLTDDHGRPQPVCSDEAAKVAAMLRRRRRRGTTETLPVTVTETSHVLTCMAEREVEIAPNGPETDGDPAASGSKVDDLKPLRLQGDLRQGGAPFQLRSIVVSRELDSTPNRIAAVTARGEPNVELEHARSMGRLAFAQAEYYFDTNRQLDDDALWELGWTARFRRFRLPDDSHAAGNSASAPSGGARGPGGSPAPSVVDGLMEACSGMAACSALKETSLNDLVVH